MVGVDGVQTTYVLMGQVKDFGFHSEMGKHWRVLSRGAATLFSVSLK